MADVYVEFPTDLIVDVHWKRAGPTTIQVSFAGYMYTNSGLPPFYNPDAVFTMDVGVSNLPPLARTSLTVPGNPSDLTSFLDQVSGSFPDGHGGTILGSYSLRQVYDSPWVTANATYTSSGNFPGLDTAGITISVHLKSLYRGDGYNWNGSAQNNALSEVVTGTAGSGESVTLAGTMGFNPPSVEIG